MLNYKQIWHEIKPTKLLNKFNLTYIYIYKTGPSYCNDNFNAINYKFEIFVAIDCKNNTLLSPHSITHSATSTITLLTTLILSLSLSQKYKSFQADPKLIVSGPITMAIAICAHKPSKLIRN